MAMLEVQGLEKSFGKNTQVLRGIDFSLESGESVAIIGSSGSGKTTLLRCLNFLTVPDAGTITVAGQTLFDAADLNTQKESQIRRKRLHFGLVFQNFNLFPQYTAKKNVMLASELLAKEQPQIKLLSAAGEQVLEKKEAEKAARKLPELSKDAQHSLTVLKKAKEYLEAKPEIAEELSAAERRKRAQLKSKPVYKYVALIISLFGVVAAAYGIHSLLTHSGNYGIYFALFGFAAIFLFSSYNMMPTARNNNSAIMKRAEKAEAAMADYLKPYPHGTFPVPSQYAHPVVLKQMMDAVEEGRAVTVPEALEAVKNRLREVNADVQVEQEEYDEVVVIKALFLNHDYQ